MKCPPRVEVASAALVFATCVVCYLNSLRCGFVFDDMSAVRDNKDLRPHTPFLNLFFNDFWGTPMHKQLLTFEELKEKKYFILGAADHFATQDLKMMEKFSSWPRNGKTPAQYGIGVKSGREQSHKSYRPLCVLTFRWNYAMHELEPMGYHLVNILLHGLVSIVYLRFCQFFLSDLGSVVAAMLFAVHPIHTEAVTGVVGRAEILSSLFFIAAMTSYFRCTGHRKKTDWQGLFLTGFFATVAMLCKEQGVTVMGVCCIYEIFIAQRLRLHELLNPTQGFVYLKSSLSPWFREMCTRLLFLLGVMLFLVLARVRIMGAQLPVFTRFDNPASVSPTPVRQMTYNYLAALNTWLLFHPSTLCCDWTMGTIPLLESITDPRNLGTFSFYAAIAKLGHFGLTAPFRHARVVIISHPFLVLAFLTSFNFASHSAIRGFEEGSHKGDVKSLSLLVFPFLPASNLFFPVGFVVAERILYTPSMGFCMLVAHGWSLLVERRIYKKTVWVLLGILIFCHAVKTVIRNYDWESEYTIFMAGLRVNQRNAKLFNNVGHALESKGKFQEALEFFQKAVIVQPDDIGAHINVGRTFNNLRHLKEAEKAYRKAKDLLPKPKPGEPYQARIAPSHLNVFLNLANLIAKNETRLEEADALYRQAISMRADYTQAYINRGDVLIKLNRTKEAQEVYEKALQYDNSNPDIYYNLGVVFLEQGKTLQALAYLDKALEYDPEHEQALMNSAILIQESGDPQLRKTAYERLLKLMQRDQRNERIYFNLGMLAMDDKDYLNAEKWFKKAVQLKQDFRSALFNLALLLSDAQRPLEAAPFLNQLLRFHPDHIKGLILLGDIYINYVKDLKLAEKCYRKILELDPHNVQGLHNLCVVHVERAELTEAEECLTKAHAIAPNEDYILRHLRIVRARIQRQKQLQQESDVEQGPQFASDHVEKNDQSYSSHLFYEAKYADDQKSSADRAVSQSFS